MISVFVPSHITGFFSIFDNEDLLLKGSLGAGVLLDKGVITQIDENENDMKDDNNDSTLSILITGSVVSYLIMLVV